MSATLVALAVLSLAKAPIDVSVDVANGDTISGQREFHVKLSETKGIVTSVEFYVNHDLRDTSTSVPYSFKLDTINEDDGNLDIEFRAYTTESETGKKALTVRIDNQVGKGPEFHTQRARDLLTDSKWDEAIIEGRIALKAKPGYNPARLAMAMAYKGKGMYDRAQKYAQDATTSDPNFRDARMLLSAIDVDRAFNTFNRGGDAGAGDSIKGALVQAIENIRKLQDEQLDAMPSSGDNLFPYVDYAMRAGRYSRALIVLSPAYKENALDPRYANRFVYANMREGHYQAALAALNSLKRANKYDAYSYALEALIQSTLGEDAAADEAIKQAVLSDADSPGVLTAQTFLGLKRSNVATLASLVDRLSQKYGQRNEIKLFVSAVLYRQGNYDDARRMFIDVVKNDPTNADAYIQEGNMAMFVAYYAKLPITDRPKQVEAAKMMFEVALEARPESAEALTGLSVVAILEKNPEDALKYAKAATVAAQSYPAGFYALSAALALSAKGVDQQRGQLTYQEAYRMVQQAGKLDKKHLEGASVPRPEQLWRYFAIEGRTPLMYAPG